VFNAGAVRFGREIVLLLRVAERPRPEPVKSWLPFFTRTTPRAGYRMLRIRKGDPDLEEIDSRVFRYRKATYLTSISALRLAGVLTAQFHGRRGPRDGTGPPRGGIRHRRSANHPDRDCYYINYSAISQMGISTGLAVTRDFAAYERLASSSSLTTATSPFSREGRRPLRLLSSTGIGHVRPADMWLATSPDCSGGRP